MTLPILRSSTSSDLDGLAFCAYPENDAGFLRPLAQLAESQGWPITRRRSDAKSKGGAATAGVKRGREGEEGGATGRRSEAQQRKAVVAPASLKPTKRKAFDDAVRYLDAHPADWEVGKQIMDQQYVVQVPQGSPVLITCRKLEQFISHCRNVRDELVSQTLDDGHIQYSSVCTLYNELIHKYHKEAFDNFQRGEAVEYGGRITTPCLLRFLVFYFQDGILACLERFLKGGGVLGPESVGLQDPSTCSSSSSSSSSAAAMTVASLSASSMSSCSSMALGVGLGLAGVGGGEDGRPRPGGKRTKKAAPRKPGARKRAQRRVTQPFMTAMCYTVPSDKILDLDGWKRS